MLLLNDIFLLVLFLFDLVNSIGSPPSILEQPLDILVVKDDPATLRCGSVGENVEITWYKDSEPVRVGNGHRLLLPNGSLFLLKVNNGGTDSDAGVYYCIAKNQYGEVRSQEANVRVAMLHDDFRINPHAVQTLIGNRVTLECSPPKGFPEPLVTWRKDDKELVIHEEGKYHQSPDGSIIIENAQRADAGFYQCVATNLVGERISKPARLSVFEKPKFLIEPKNVIAEVNSSVLFECRVLGEPMPSISWKKRNGQMPIGRAYVARDRGGLRIEKVHSDDAGEYVCFAKNAVGIIESSAQLIVNVPPAFTKLPKNLRITQDRTAVFECEAIGHPAPGIFWSKEGDQLFTYFSGLISSDGRVQVTKDGRLIIDNVSQLDQGNYICAAVNSAGSTLAKASLGVISDVNNSYPPPIIQYGHQNQTLMYNDMAILPCQATGRVPVEITWIKNGYNLDFNTTENKGRYRQLPIGTLQITDLRKQDSGVYTCRAKNEDGEASWTASLVAEEHTNHNTIFHRMPDAAALPSSPGQPKVLEVTENSIELEWTAPERQGASPIIGYLLQYWSPELGESWRNILETVSKTKFKVNNLQSAHSYIFIVRAENSKGIGLPSLMSEITSTKKATEGLDDAERRQKLNRLLDLETARQKLASEQLIKLLEIRALNASAILLSWKRQKIEPLVQGYYIKWRGPPIAQDHNWFNVTNSETDHVIINGLKPFSNYEFFVIPYHQQIQGMPSNSLDGTTAEAPPSLPPSDVRLRMLNITSLRVSWRPPPAEAMNGILKGFTINIKSNHSAVEDRNISTNERATSVTLYRLIPHASYAIRVAARTNAGVGLFYNGEPVVMTEETFRQHNKLYEKSDYTWYRQPWSVLACGIVLWCLLLLGLVLFWYRCWHRNEHERTNGSKDFIKIRDGSVANDTMVGGDARNAAFWTAHEHFNGGTVETCSGTLARLGQHQNFGHLQQQTTHCSSDFAVGACTNGKALLNIAGSTNALFGNGIQTQQFLTNNIVGEGSSLHSLHYHYAQFTAEEHSCLSTFLQQKPNPEHYDDPSPYATTTLVTPSGTVTQTLRKGPVLPMKPVPKEPPRNFLSSAAVMHHAINYVDHVDEPKYQASSNSCGALHELNGEGKRITAVENKKSHRKNSQQRKKQQGNNGRCQQQFGTSEWSTTRNGGSCKINTKNTTSSNAFMKQSSFYSLRRITHKHSQQKNNILHHQQQLQESPQTDISYLQSSDGTNSSNNYNFNKGDEQQSGRDVPEYDPVMTDSLSQMLLSNTRKGCSKKNRNERTRVSLIEDEEIEEKDLLMSYEDEHEADGEMSENDYHNENNVFELNHVRPFTSSTTVSDDTKNEHYYGFFPAQQRKPTRQPMMGVNISTLSAGTDRRSLSPTPHR